MICSLGLAAIGILMQAQPEARRITFNTPQTSYSLPVSDRNNVEYVGLLEAIEPMGTVSAKVDGQKWKLKFRDVEAQFENGKTRAKIRGNSIELSAPFVLDNARGLVPIRSLKDLLPSLLTLPVDLHQAARRVFIGVPATRVSAKKSDAGKVSFTFSAPVNPFIATDAGKLRMVFVRDPLQADWQSQSFDDQLLPNATYAEANGAAELTVKSSAPLIATFSDDRKTITVAAVPPAPAAQQPPAQAKTNTPPAQPSAPPPPKPRPSIIIDAAHGGDDPGATLSEKIVEKDITLALARQLKRELDNRGIPCIMLRDGDASITTYDRASLVNSSKAAVYVAIHASSVGSGVRTFTASVSSEHLKPIQFLRVNAAQAPYIGASRGLASLISTEFLKRDMPVISAPGAVAPLSNIHVAAVAVEVAPPPHGSAADLASASYQRSVATALASALAAIQSRQAER